MSSLPTGIIMIWSGTLGSIPAGWQLCDGTNGSPNLQNYFIRCASSTVPPGTTGGAASHSHTWTGSGHAHDFDLGSDIQTGTGFADRTTTEFASGITNSANNRPPYYALAYIYKL